jgi:hypothetical protein
MVLATEQDLACNVRSAAQMLPDLIGAGDRDTLCQRLRHLEHLAGRRRPKVESPDPLPKPFCSATDERRQSRPKPFGNSTA